MTPEAITLLLKEATEAFTVIEGKPSDNDILAIRKTLLPLLMDIPFDLVGGIHSLTGLITETATYKADHGNVVFVRPTRLPLYNSTFPDNATTVQRVKLKQLTKPSLTTTQVTKRRNTGWNYSSGRLSTISGSTT